MNTTMPRVGAVVDQDNLSKDGVIERARLAVESGADTLWLVQQPNQRDSSILLTSLAENTEGVRIASGILPIYSRPPIVMAQTAITIDEVSDGRFILGLGVGHRVVGEWTLGGSYPPPAPAMREYLTIVTDLIRTGEVNVSGRWFSGRMSYLQGARPDLPVYVGSLGPKVLELAGELADGVVLWICTPEDVRDRVMPHLRAGWARRGADRGEFAVVVMLMAAATDTLSEDREAFRKILAGYMRMENTRKQLIASGFGDDVRAGRPSDAAVHAIAAIGDRKEVAERIVAFREAGATHFAVSPLVTTPEFGPARYTSTLEAVLDA
ncbi:MAG: LLM class flavin-dependent oxidoreductase [Micromonosporaceae bacterium]|nr:LLM class flavin-dependent oxidoreductase [Micromonosporaceae bacterium]